MGEYFKVLAIDGGGIRGVIAATVLAHLEASTGRQTFEMFDLIAGTSTGGILALGVAKPDETGQHAQYWARDIIKLYEDEGRHIFAKRWRGLSFDERYSSEGVEGVLRRYFGETHLRSALKNVIITSYDIERRRPVIFSSAHAGSDILSKRREHDFLMWEVARATTAAPTYFEPARLFAHDPEEYFALVDGGIFANNPSLCAYIEALKMKQPDQKIMVVSLGTGEQTNALRYDDVRGWKMFDWAKQIFHLVNDGVSNNVEYVMNHLVREGERYYRLQTKLHEKNWALDNANRANIRALEDLAKVLIQTQTETLDVICGRLSQD